MHVKTDHQTMKQKQMNFKKLEGQLLESLSTGIAGYSKLCSKRD